MTKSTMTVKKKAQQLRTNWLRRAKQKKIDKETVPMPREIEGWLRFQLSDEATFTCDYSNEKVPLDKVEFDHAFPLSLGGSMKLGNVVPCTKNMNKAKGEFTADEFDQLLSLPWKKERKEYLLKRLRAGGFMYYPKRRKR